MSDLNRNLLLLNQLYWQSGRKNDAQRVLLDALQLANRTGFISHFVIEGEAMAQQLRQLIQLNTLPEMEQHRAQRILREINQHHRINSPILTKASSSACLTIRMSRSLFAPARSPSVNGRC